ncbi:GNAT family N-acetyltransferase [Ornithinimicrobium sufpigmenti]|uniref:GNAT family N-acetyltransferase n=1 Tax=Ornithinimicrobium sufpigmenti TaxID=2508882 RepID=UPI00103671B4|nr:MULTISPECIES: GNAT family N-acetyltransferase [unclassified Ornithinimicrobium]
MDLSFSRAGPADVEAVQTVYRQIIDHLAVTVDFPHWHTENHPTPHQVEQWVRAGDLYVAVTQRGDPAAERVAGAVVLDHQAPEAYGAAPWAIEAGTEEVLVVHVLGVAPDFLRRGVASFLVEASLDLARQKGCRTVRLDAYVENLPARELYTRHGFTDLGVHTVRYEGTDLSRFHLFERVL